MSTQFEDHIKVRGANQHNLKNVSVDIPRNALTVITGVSGSGKSSLAFDTIYAEGQRRYVESLSAYARQFIGQLERPNVESIEGLCPSISIEQKTVSKNPRSTVGTITEIYDYLRLLFSRVATPRCYITGQPMSALDPVAIVDAVMKYPAGSRLNLIAPVAQGKKGEFQKEFAQFRKDGFIKIRVDGKMHDLGSDIEMDKNKKHDIDLFIDRVELKSDMRSRIDDAVRIGLRLGKGFFKVEDITELPPKVRIFNEKLSCLESGVSYPNPQPNIFSFNSPQGMCMTCKGTGYEPKVSLEKVMPDPTLSLAEGGLAPLRPDTDLGITNIKLIAKQFDVPVSAPLESLDKEILKEILFGHPRKKIKFILQGSRGGQIPIQGIWEGFVPLLEKRYKEVEELRADLDEFFEKVPCSTCKGSRLRIESTHFFILDKSIADLCNMEIGDLYTFFEKLKLNDREWLVAERIVKEIKDRLNFLKGVGLDYLTLARTSNTLSGGESQRIRLATQIGSSLTGVLYVLDEPSIGLHQSDNGRLIQTLHKLRDLGNTVIVVEHDRETMNAADYIVDMGPGAGVHGGTIITQGTFNTIVKEGKSATAQFLSHQKLVPMQKPRPLHKGAMISVKKLNLNNLKDFSIKIPLGVLVGIAGVSGSGKSSLIIDALYPALKAKLRRGDSSVPVEEISGLENIDRVIDVDQSPIGRTPRSNPATYVGFFSVIRDIFAQTPEAKVKGYKPGRFSFNIKGGRCDQCSGDGFIRVEMHFMPDVYVKCDACKGRRYNQETLAIRFNGKNIADVLEMTVEDALNFFTNIPAVKRPLQTLFDVGLGYITLGQSATTLSGGEAQRIKLSKELSKRTTGKTLFILDEPSTGLHFEDIVQLIKIMHALVDQGNTVFVIEHNMEILATCDYIIDMGPGGGRHGGKVVAEGTPTEILKSKSSVTGPYLKELIRSH